jgi:putative PIN family toxin of toxin-antitoxin system
MRLVLDTNVIISALVFDGLPEKLLISTLSGAHELVLSQYIIGETTRILESRFKVHPTNLNLLQQLLHESEVVYFEPFLHVITDEPDNRILETAIKGGATYLVTGDKLILSLGQYDGIKIISIKEAEAII